MFQVPCLPWVCATRTRTNTSRLTMDDVEDTSDLSDLPFEVLQKLQEKVGVKRFREYVKEQELRKKAKGSTTAWDDQDDDDGAGPAGQTSTAARQIACAMACCDVVHCTCVHGGLACGGLHGGGFLALVCVGHASVGGRACDTLCCVSSGHPRHTQGQLNSRHSTRRLPC
jgi:hypothetical protein